jgi:hypothetical protein
MAFSEACCIGQGDALSEAESEGAEVLRGRVRKEREHQGAEKKNPRFEAGGFGCHLPGGR